MVIIRWFTSGAIAVIAGFLAYQLLLSNEMFAIVVAVNIFVVAAWIPLKKHGRAHWIIAIYPMLMWGLTSIMCTVLNITEAIPIVILLISMSSMTLSGKLIKERV